ncbi:MAG: DoxX family membrane protein [Simkania negevensis]|nr:DoxX family membrane protein [Simkania negevensis]
MGQDRGFFGFIGRACISMIFIISGLNQIFDWQKVEEGLVMTLYEWHMHVEGLFIAEKLFEFLIPLASLLLGVALGLQLLGGLMLFFGIKIKFAAFLLLLFLIPVTMVYHAFWLQVGDRFRLELVNFLKNTAILGSLILLVRGGGRQAESD